MTVLTGIGNISGHGFDVTVHFTPTLLITMIIIVIADGGFDDVRVRVLVHDVVRRVVPAQYVHQSAGQRAVVGRQALPVHQRRQAVDLLADDVHVQPRQLRRAVAVRRRRRPTVRRRGIRSRFQPLVDLQRFVVASSDCFQ